MHDFLYDKYKKKPTANKRPRVIKLRLAHVGKIERAFRPDISLSLFNYANGK